MQAIPMMQMAIRFKILHGKLSTPRRARHEIVNPSNIIAEFTPDEIGNYTMEFYVDDGEDFCKETLVLTAVITVPEITPYTVSQSLTNGTEMTDITFSSIGGYIVSMEIHPELPEGLLFDDQSGRISGTPTEVITETIFTVYANNSAGSGTSNVTLSVTEQGYDATDLAQFWLDFFQCQSTDDRPSVDDLTTTATETHQCEVSITLNETHLIITTNGLPNHDFESTLACSGGGDCATASHTPGRFLGVQLTIPQEVMKAQIVPKPMVTKNAPQIEVLLLLQSMGFLSTARKMAPEVMPLLLTMESTMKIDNLSN